MALSAFGGGRVARLNMSTREGIHFSFGGSSYSTAHALPERGPKREDGFASNEQPPFEPRVIQAARIRLPKELIPPACHRIIEAIPQRPGQDSSR